MCISRLSEIKNVVAVFFGEREEVYKCNNKDSRPPNCENPSVITDESILHVGSAGEFARHAHFARNHPHRQAKDSDATAWKDTQFQGTEPPNIKQTTRDTQNTVACKTFPRLAKPSEDCSFFDSVPEQPATLLLASG